MEAILIYLMMTNLLPKSCIKEIQKLQRGFIWGDIGISKTITRAKAEDGLGLRDLGVINQACIMKLGSKVINQEPDL